MVPGPPFYVCLKCDDPPLVNYPSSKVKESKPSFWSEFPEMERLSGVPGSFTPWGSGWSRSLPVPDRDSTGYASTGGSAHCVILTGRITGSPLVNRETLVLPGPFCCFRCFYESVPDLNTHRGEDDPSPISEDYLGPDTVGGYSSGCHCHCYCVTLGEDTEPVTGT